MNRSKDPRSFRKIFPRRDSYPTSRIYYYELSRSTNPTRSSSFCSSAFSQSLCSFDEQTFSKNQHTQSGHSPLLGYE